MNIFYFEFSLSVYCEFVFLALFVFEMSVRMYALGRVENGIFWNFSGQMVDHTNKHYGEDTLGED